MRAALAAAALAALLPAAPFAADEAATLAALKGNPPSSVSPQPVSSPPRSVSWAGSFRAA